MGPPRINRYLAQCGLGSRRAVEELVRAGRVRIDGETVVELSRRVNEGEVVTVDGQAVQPDRVGRLLLLHKPVGVVSSLVRQDQRRCVLDLIPADYSSGRLFHVGRLDADSSGLLLLTDDGDLAQALLHPSRPVWKTYRMQIRPVPTPEEIERLAAGSLELDGRAVAPARVRLLDRSGGLARLEVSLREGRNRQLRRMVEQIGGRVLSLQRIAFGPLELGDLREGAVREATGAEWSQLRELVHGER